MSQGQASLAAEVHACLQINPPPMSLPPLVSPSLHHPLSLGKNTNKGHRDKPAILYYLLSHSYS